MGVCAQPKVNALAHIKIENETIVGLVGRPADHRTGSDREQNALLLHIDHDHALLGHA